MTPPSPWERFRGPRDGPLIVLTVVACGLWISCVGPVRTWALDAGVRDHWFIGIAPSLFAGATFALWQMLVTRTTPLASMAYGVMLTLLAEVVQWGFPVGTADPVDAAAGAVGALLAYPMLRWRWPHVRESVRLGTEAGEG